MSDPRRGGERDRKRRREPQGEVEETSEESWIKKG